MTRIRVLMTAAVSLLCATAFALPASAETSGAYARFIHSVNPHLQVHQTKTLADAVLRDAKRQNIDARLLAALITVESHWKPDAVSRHGARGLGQLMPQTAHGLGVDARRPLENLRGTSRYLGGLLARFGASGANLRLAIGAYNAGPNAIKRANGIPNNGETPTYVKRVLAMWHSISKDVDSTVRSLPAHAITTIAATAPMPTAAYETILAAAVETP